MNKEDNIKKQEHEKSTKHDGVSKQGGQKGHLGYSRELYPEGDCQDIKNHVPEVCNCCGEKLSGEDDFPYTSNR